MTSTDFAAAQQRIAARRRERAAEAQTRIESARSQRVSNGLARLPFPIQGLARGGVETWETIKGREGTHPEFRVGQVDAELLDEELLSLLGTQVGEGLKYFGVCGISVHLDNFH